MIEVILSRIHKNVSRCSLQVISDSGVLLELGSAYCHNNVNSLQFNSQHETPLDILAIIVIIV